LIISKGDILMNAVVILTRVQAENIDAFNRVAVAAADAPNGTAFTLAFPSAVGDEKFVATKATTGLEFKIGRKEPIDIATGDMLTSEKYDAYLLEVTSNTGVWMAVTPEVNKQIVGEIYGGADVRYFTNKANKPMDVVYLQKGDIIQVSKDFFAENYDPATVTDAVKVTLTADGYKASTQA
jgi:hypothetical protein